MTLTPCTPTELRRELRAGAVQFAFKKLDGVLRTAVGTSNLATIPAEFHPTGRREAPDSVVTFFDLEKREWRCVSTRVEIFIRN